MNPYLQNVEAMRKQGASDSDIEAYLRSVGAKEAEPAPRSAFSELTRGAALGLAKTGTSFGEVVGMIPGLGAVGEASRRAAEEAEAFYDPRGGFGTAGQFVGRGVGELATAIATGGPLAKLVAKAPGAGKIISTGMAQGATKAQRAKAIALANAPVDIIQGAKEEEGILLPGRAGSIAENVLFSGAGGAVSAAADAKRAAKASETAKAAEVATAEKQATIERLMAEPGTPTSQALREFERFRAGYGPKALEIPAREVPAAPSVREAIEQMREQSAEVARRQQTLAEIAARVPTPTTQYAGLAGPELPAGEIPVEAAGSWLADIAKRARIPVEEPLIQLVESGTRTRQQQAVYMRSVKKTADRLEREARRRRALPSPDMDAIAQIEAAAEVGRRIAASEGGSVILPPFATYDIGGLAGVGLKQALREPVVGALTGAGVGALTGDTEDPYDIVGRAITGAAVGAGISKAAVRRLAIPRKPVPGATEALDTRTPYQRELAAETVGTRKGDKLNLSVQLLDPTGKRLLDEEVKALEKAGYTRRAVSDAEIDRFAAEVDIPELVKADVRKLDTVQIAALGRRIGEDRTVLNDMVKRLDDSGLTDIERQQFEFARDAAMERLVSYDRLLDTAGSEQGRGLRMLGRIMRQSGAQDISQAYKMAKQMSGLKPGQDLSETAQAAIRDVFTNPKYKTAAQRDEQLAKVLGDMQQGSWLDVLLDSRAAGFLSSLVSTVTNVFGSKLAATSNAIANPIAAAIDNSLYKAGLIGDRSVMAGSGRAAAYAGKFKESLPKVLDKRRYQGIDPEKPLAEMQRKKLNYINSLRLSPKEGELAWRKTLRGGAKIIEAGNNAVYGLMTATDVPFYDAALAAALKERAALRAAREMPKAINSDMFFRRVEQLMDPMTADPVDATMALAEALDATFKTPTRVARFVKEMGPVGRFLSPFTNTVTNLVWRGFEDIPGVGFAPAEIRASGLKKKLEAIKASPEEIAREMRRYRTRVAGRQATTGIGAIGLGYMLARSGRLTGEYVEPAGATPEEREEMKRQRMTGQAPLTLRVGDKSYSLAPFAFMIPGIVIGAALAEASKDDDVELPALAMATAKTMGRTIADLPMLSGVQNVEKLLKFDPVALGKEAASLIPFSSAIATVGRAMDPVVKRQPETFTEAVKERLPILRESVAPDVGPLGEVTTRERTVGNVLNVLANPFRPAPVRTGALYDALQALETYPPPGPRREAGGKKEERARYVERRQLEGPQERALLEGLLAGDPQAWAFVPEGTRRKFFTAAQRGQTEQGAWRELLSGALSAQRSAVTSYDRQQATRQAILEGLLPNTIPFTTRVEQLMAGQP